MLRIPESCPGCWPVTWQGAPWWVAVIFLIAACSLRSNTVAA